jgi:3',5'-cyclic AMP phosphodiesterase CpdA
MRSIGLLHLSNLHLSVDGNDEALAYEGLVGDLTRLHSQLGPWDLIVISGDLTRTGVSAEFARVRSMLDHLWSTLERLGSWPVLLVVPGNGLDHRFGHFEFHYVPRLRDSKGLP